MLPKRGRIFWPGIFRPGFADAKNLAEKFNIFSISAFLIRIEKFRKKKDKIITEFEKSAQIIHFYFWRFCNIFKIFHWTFFFQNYKMRLFHKKIIFRKIFQYFDKILKSINLIKSQLRKKVSFFLFGFKNTAKIELKWPKGINLPRKNE